MMQAAQTFRSMFRIALTVLLVATGSAQAWAQAVNSWALETHSGQVRLVKSGIVPIALTVGDVLAGGDWIETGPDGRAVLRRGAESIVVAPNSRIGLPQVNNGPYATRILQTLGTILLTVEKQAAQHFEVVTPYLTAVVKGTTFTVGIQGTRASVHVVNGLVEVTNLANGKSSLIRPGQTGAVFGGGDPDAGVRIEGGTARAAAPLRGDAEAGDAAAAAPVLGGPSQATIKQTLDPVGLNLDESTAGLLRAADRAAPSASFGAPGAQTADGKVLGLGQRPATTAGPVAGQSLALGQGLGVSADQSLGLGQTAAVSTNPGNGVAAVIANGQGRAVGLGRSPNAGNATGKDDTGN